MDLKEFRGAYPQYDDMPDQELVDGLHAKHYSDIPKDDFYKSIGFNPAPAERSTFQKYIADPAARGYNRIEQAVNVGSMLAGVSTPEEAAANIAANQKDIASYPVPADIEAGTKEIMDSQTYWDATKAAIRNPKAISNVFVESIANSLPSVITGVTGALGGALAGSAVPVVGTVAGATGGAAAGVGLGSGITEFLGSINEQMSESKVDMNDEVAIAKALTDPVFMEGAKDKALKRGVAIGLFDALSAGFAGRIAGPVGKAVGAAGLPGKKLTGELAEVAMQAGAGGAGEYAAQQWTGEDKPGAVILEMAAEVPSGIGEIAGGRMLKNMGAKPAEPPPPAPPPPTTMPNARAALGQPPAPGTVASPASPPGNGAAPGGVSPPGAGSPPPTPPAVGAQIQFRDSATGEAGTGTVLALDDVDLEDGTVIPNITIDLGNGRVKDAPLADLEIGAVQGNGNAGTFTTPDAKETVAAPGQVDPTPDMTGEPALPAGHVRLYRGVGKNLGEAAGTAFLTTNKNKAGQYGDVHYVDVPATRESLVRFIQGHGGPDEFVTDSQEVLGALKPLAPSQPVTPSQTADLDAVLASVDAGGVPGFLTNNLRSLANKYGVDFQGKTPAQVIEELRAKRGATPPVTPAAAPAAPTPDAAQAVQAMAEKFNSDQQKLAELREQIAAEAVSAASEPIAPVAAPYVINPDNSVTIDGMTFRGQGGRPFKSREEAEAFAVARVGGAAAQPADPTPAQAEAGNYKKKPIAWNGLNISIETAAGQTRRSKDPNGPKWEVVMPADYGYVRRTEGADGEQVDVYVGPNPESQQVFVVDQIDPKAGKFDEHKVMVGFSDEAAARTAYAGGFSDGSGPSRAGAVTPMSVDGLKQWLKTGDTKKPVAYALAKKLPADRRAEKAAKEAAAKEIRPGKVGDMLEAGQVVTTTTGRQTTPFPKLGFGSDRKAANTVKAVDRWLMQNALDEARARGDDFNARMFEQNLEKPSQADKDDAEAYLFDQDFNQPVPKPILKPLGGQPASPESPRNRAPVTEMPGKRTLKEYQMQGGNAANEGWAITNDPYYESSPASNAWRKGWRDARKSIEAARQSAEVPKPHTPAKHRAGYGNDALQAKILERAQKSLERKGIKTRLAGGALEATAPVTAESDVAVADEIQRQIEISAGRSTASRERGGPQTSAMKLYGILGWIAKRGGMIDSDGIMKEMDLDTWHKGKPGMRKVIRDYGVQADGNLLGRVDSDGRDYSPDGTLAAAIEDDILMPDATLNDLYEEIRKSDAMKKPRPDPEVDEQEQRARERIADFVSENRKRARFTEDMSNDALDRVRNGATIEDAVDGVIEDDAIYGERDLALDAKQDEVGDGWDIPFEIDTRPAQKAGGAATPESGQAAEADGAAKAAGEAESGGVGGDSKQEGSVGAEPEWNDGIDYPTTLEKVAQKPRPGQGRLTHVYAEYRGGRYYLASISGNPDGPVAEWRKTFPGIAIYATDRADGTSINGQIAELERAIDAQSKPAIDKVSTVDGVKDQIVIPGAEQKSAAEAKAAEDARIKAIEDEKEALRKNQSKLRKGNQKSVKDQAGGLFSAELDQDDMFAAPKAPAKVGAPEPRGESESQPLSPDEAESVARNIKKHGFPVFGEKYVYFSPLRPLGFGFPIKGKSYNAEHIGGSQAVDLSRVLVTDAPIPTTQLHRLDLFPVTPDARFHALKDAYAATPGAKSGRYELRDPKRMDIGSGISITPSAKESGRFQLTYFDANGFSGDMSEASIDDALKAAMNMGYTIPAPGHLADMMENDSFQDLSQQDESDRAIARGESDLSETERKEIREAAKYLGDFAYSADSILGDDRRAIARLSTELGKSGRDTLLMAKFNITRDVAHNINNELDVRSPQHLRAVDMEDAFTMFPELRAIVDAARSKAPAPAKAATRRVTSQILTTDAFNSFLKIAADSIEQLRKGDVERVIKETPAHYRSNMGSRIAAARPDLAEEVKAVEDEIRGESAPTVPADQVALLRILGWDETSIEEATPAERAQAIADGEEAAKSVQVVLGHSNEPGSYFIASGDKNAMYTLRKVTQPISGALGGIDDIYIANLAEKQGDAINKAKFIVAANGGTRLYSNPPQLNARESIGGSGGAGNAVVDRSGAPAEIAPDSIPRPPAELTDQEAIAQHGLVVSKETAKSGKVYWAVTGNLAGNKAVLDAMKFGDPFKMGGKQYRSIRTGDPTAALAAALRGAPMEPVAEIAPPGSATEPGEAVRVLMGAKLKIEQDGDKWIVAGKGTFDAKDAIKSAGGKWDSASKKWRFDRDPTEAIAAALNQQKAGDGGNAEGDAGAGVNADEDARLRELRQREDQRPDERDNARDVGRYVGADTQALIRNGIKFGIPEVVVADQIEDVAMINSAYQNGKPAFILANEAGTGKTFVLGGAIREMRKAGAKNFVYVTMNQDLIAQIKRDLAPYGVDDVKFHTYSELSGSSGIDTKDAVLIFDEAHNIKNVGGGTARAEAGQGNMAEAKFTVIASATPFENPVESRYLQATGIFDKVGGFNEWAKAYGAAVKRRKFYNPRTGKQQVEEIIYWVGGKSKKKDAAAARQWFFNQAVMSQRPMRIDPSMVDVQFRRAKVPEQWVDMYDRVSSAYEEAEREFRDEDGNSRDYKITSEIARHRENTIKRILEASKVQFAIDRARERLTDGKNVVIFVETKADRELGRFRKSEHFKDPTLYTFPQMQSLMEEWRAEADMARARDERAPPKPFADFIYEIARAFHDMGISYELPSTADEITKALGADNVAIYTGAVSNTAAAKNKADFLAGKKTVLVATMAKGGTGLSLHDTRGDRPTVQININLPWKATGVDQVSGRVARYGLQSKAEIEWLFASNIAWESTKLAPRVGARMRDMGAVVKGLEIKAAEALDGNFDFEGAIDIKQVAGEGAIDVAAGEDGSLGSGDIYDAADRLERNRVKAENTSGGFFATPFPVAAFMQRISGVRPGETVLEPSAGHGNLIRFMPEGTKITAIEQRQDNFETLGKIMGDRADLHNADFMAWAGENPSKQFDVIVMNPPFERLKGVGPQDALHVRTAYDMLAPGGRLVAIMGEGVFFRQFKEETAFREWLDDAGATVIKLPEDTFKRSGTSARARMIVIDKDRPGGRSDISLDDVSAAALRDEEGIVPRRVSDRASFSRETITDTAAFRKWFGDSKVVDADGKPLVVYHGSPDARFLKGDDAQFKGTAARFGMPERADDGAFWFAQSRGTAASYADDRRAFDYQNAEPGVSSFYVSLRNPLIVDGGGKEWREAQSRGKTSDVIDEARAAGNDGVIIRNVRDNYNNDKKTKATDTYVAFSPTQIKSVNNRGTFDPNDPRILFDRDTTPSAPPAYMKAEKIKDATIYTDARTADARTDMARRLNAMISRIAGNGVRLRVVDRIEADAGGMGFGLFPRDDTGTIYVTLRDLAGMTETTTHELIHLMRTANMIDMKAWAVLSARAPEWRVRFKTEEKYAPDIAAWRADGMPEAEVQRRLDEEAIADAAKEYGAGRLDATGALARVLEMVNRFLELIRNILDGYGATTAKGILADIHAGRFADGRRVGGMGGAQSESAMQRAWHGTPHKVDKFSLDKIGTGEGNQAYGWGLYFAGRKKVGEHYRKNLSGEKILTIDGADLDGNWFDPVQRTDAEYKLYESVKGELRGTPINIIFSAIKHVLGKEYYGERIVLEDSAKSLAYQFGLGAAATREREANYTKALSAIMQRDISSRAAGNLYKVDIAPEDNQLLDWDVRPSNQPEAVMAALESVADRPELKDEREISWGGGPIDWTQFESGKDIYQWLSDNLGSDKAASLALRDAGIPGIRYLDGSSRKARDGTHNYVIFDDSLVTITGSFDRATDEAAALDVARRDIRTIVDTVFRAPKPADSVEVIEEKTADDISWFKRMLYTPEAIFRNLAKSSNPKTAKLGRALYALWQKAVKLETDQSEYLHRLRREVSAVRDAVDEDTWKSAWDVLWTGDAEGVEYTPAETAAMVAAGELTADAAKTYHAMRKVFDQMGRFVDQHERKMKPTIRKRKFQLLRMMARDLGVQETEFRGRMAYIGSLRAQLRDGTADPEAMAAKIEQETERLFGAKVDDPRFMEMDAELKSIDARLSSTTVRKREGYVPHKFFGTWAVYAKEMNAEGEEVLRLLASEKEGFYPDRDTAVRGANAHVAANPGAQVVVRPVQFKFPNSQATEMSDAAYFRFMGNVEREFEVSGQELQDVVQGVARKRYRRRSASFKNFRQGIEGYSRQIDAVMNAHIGEVVRYVIMDELKYEAINTFERNGLSRNRSAITDNPTLAGFVEQWFKDINGQKQATENQLDELLSKRWARPLNVAMASGAVAFLAGGGITASPAIGLALGGYVGYRMYKGMAAGGNFKTRAITGGMLSDMAHLKLGAFTNVMSAVVNLSQTVMNTWPVLGSKWTAVGIKRYTKAMHDQMLGRANPDIALLRRANVNTVFKQSEVSPHLFEGESGLARASMFLFNQAESLNRGVAFLGAYARAEATRATPGAALRDAKAVLLRTQFHYGAANKPEVLRNVLLRVPLQFKNFLAQQLTFMFSLNKAELGKFLLATFLLAGALGMPGAELLDMLLDALVGFSPLVEIKRLMAKAMAEGGAAGGMATMLAHGLPALFGIDTSSRTGMGDMFPNEGRDLIGPWASTMIGAAKMGAENASFVDQLRALSPGLGAPLKSVEAAANGLPITMWPGEAAKAIAGEPSVFNDGKAMLTNPNKRNRLEYEPTSGELAAKAIGALPTRESQMRDLNRVMVYDDQKADKKRARAIDEIVINIKRGDYEAIQEIRAKAFEDGIVIKPSMIKDALKKANTPRLERLINALPKWDRPGAQQSYQAILNQNEGDD